MERTWGFMRPWCESLRGTLSYQPLMCDATTSEEDEDEEFEVAPFYIHIVPPQSFMNMYGPQQQTTLDIDVLREPLALLSTVAKVDFAAYKHLMAYYFQIDVDGFNGLPCYVLELEHNITRDIVKMCGTRQRTNPSANYLAAMEQIALLYRGVFPAIAERDVQVPVRIYKSSREWVLAKLSEVHAAEAAVSKEWRLHEQSPENHGVPPGSLRCTFFLEPMVANLRAVQSTMFGSDVVDFKETAVTLSRLLQHNFRLSHLSLEIESPRGSAKTRVELFAQLTTTLFGSIRRYPELANTRYQIERDPFSRKSRPLQLDTLHLNCHNLHPLDFEALCTALATNQTTRELTIKANLRSFIGLRTAATSERDVWKWLAYGLFSKRARECSALESLTLVSVDSMTTADVGEIESVVTSDHPEEYMHGCQPGSMPARQATLRSGAPIFLLASVTKSGRPRSGATSLGFPSARHPVITFGDNGQSECVNVLIPGVGRCSVRRADLEFDEVQSVGVRSELESLKIVFPDYGNEARFAGLERFLSLVGSSLKSLTCDAPTLTLDDNAILRHCPNLQVFWRRQGIILARFDFSDYHTKQLPLPTLQFQWNSVSAVVAALSDNANPVAKCVRLLQLRLTNVHNIFSRFTMYYPLVDRYLDALLQMLEVNRTLEHLQVIVPSDCDGYEEKFNRYHHQVIGGWMALETKIAFLSVLSTTPELKFNKKQRAEAHNVYSYGVSLGQDVVSSIFSFGAAPVFRKVVFRSNQYYPETDY